ncbi:MAG: pantetheine-phosphate adenylyltransferase [Granulosicoccus sp.]|nr:pantetheine-phosphate adenylyltransferase [Granulosicoccus sp.]
MDRQVTAVYPGTFDPMTLGHVDVAVRASKMFDRLVIAVVAGGNKTPYFSLDERVEIARDILRDNDKIEVLPFDGLLVNFGQKIGASVIVRGLRAISDFDYEVQIAGVNRHLAPDIETVFIAASEDYTFLSSSIVREVAGLDGDVSAFVDPRVLRAFAEKKSQAES